GGLNAGDDGFNLPDIDVADHSPAVWTLDEQLHELLVLQNRDPRLTRTSVNEDFSFHHVPPRTRPATRRLRQGRLPKNVGADRRVRRCFSVANQASDAFPLMVPTPRVARKSHAGQAANVLSDVEESMMLVA